MIKMRLVFILFGLLAVTHYVNARPNKAKEEGYDDDKDMMNDDYNDDDYEDEDEADEEGTRGPPPTMRSENMNFKMNPGDSVVLPCDASNTDAYVIMWKKNTELIFQDKIPVGSREPRYTLFLNRSLEIKNLNSNDTSDYECSIYIGPLEEIKVTHKLEVATPPKIISLLPASEVEVRLGGILELVCNASGIPEPKVSWSKGGNRVVTNHGNYDGPSITFDSIQKDNAGIYQCLADNGVGVPATAAVEIRVTYPPTIKIEKLTVNTAEGYESQLTCIVHAIPRAVVAWTKGMEPLESNDHINIMTDGNRHILKILRTRKIDFGNYTCTAESQLGRTEKHIILSGKPAPAEFVATKMSPDGEEVQMEWRVESNSPITEYQLQYRSKNNKDEEWKTEKPKVVNAEGNMYSVTHVIKDLSLGMYEAKLRSKNTYGWSSYSHHNTFGLEHEHHHNHEEPIPVSENREEPMRVSSGAERTISSLLFVGIFVLYSKFV